MSDAIAAIATGNQVCAIGIVRLSGDGVIEMAQQLFTPERGPALSEQPDRKLCYGRLCRRDFYRGLTENNRTSALPL